MKYRTIFKNNHFKSFVKLLNLNVEEYTIIKNVAHYECMFVFGEHMYIKVNGPEDSLGRVTHSLELKGQGCREFETNGGDWFSLIKYVKENNLVLTTNDIACDIMTPKYFTMDMLVKKTLDEHYVTRFRNNNIINGNNQSGKTGTTIYFGKRGSNQVTIYDKKHERIYRGKKVDINFWIRIELRFKTNKTKDIIDLLYCHGSMDYLPKLFFLLLNDILVFKQPPRGKRKHVKDKKNWPIWKYWERFVGTADKIHIVNQAALENSITRSAEWLIHSAGIKFIEVMSTMTDEQKLVFFGKIIDAKINKIDNRALRRINRERKNNGLKPFDDLNDYYLSISKTGLV